MISHNVKPAMKAIVQRFKETADIGAPKQPLEGLSGEIKTTFAHRMVDEFESSLRELDQDPRDQDRRVGHVELSDPSEGTASMHKQNGTVTLEAEGPESVYFAQRNQDNVDVVVAHSQGNTYIAEAYHVTPQGGYTQELERTARGGITPPPGFQ